MKWDYDNRFGHFDLYFDELIRSWTFNISKMKMQSTANFTNDTDIFSFDMFEDDLAEDVNTTVLSFHMAADSYAIMTSDMDTLVGRENTSTFLTLDAGAVQNSYLFTSNADVHNTSHALAVSNFLVDTVDPFVIEFSIDMDIGYVNITSNEPIDPDSFTTYGTAYQSKRNSFNGQGIYAQAVDNGASPIFDLRNLGRTWSYYLPRADINSIKSDSGLCNTLADCYMSAWQPFVNDANGNPMTSVGYDVFFGMRASSFFPDVSPPALERWGLDLNTGMLVIYFSEVIYYKTLNFSSISIFTTQNTTNSTIKGFRVVNPDNVELQFTDDSTNRDTVYCQLSPGQVAVLYNIEEFQRGVEFTYLTIDKNAVKDTSVRENLFQGTGSTIAIQANYSIADETSPEIVSFDLNMTSQILTLRFTEVIDPDSIAVDKLSLQSQLSISALSSTQLMDETIATVLPYDVFGTDLYIQFTPLGFAELKNTGRLAVSGVTTFLVAEAEFCTDRALAKNILSEIDAASSQAVTNYFPDLVRPTLLSWDIDMGVDLLNLTFSEPIDETTFNITELIIKTDETTVQSTIVVQLTDSTFVNQGKGEVIVYLSLTDLNSVKKQPPLCITSDKCYIEFSSSLAADISTFYESGVRVQNSVEALSGAQVSSLTADTRPPVLLSFEIDVNIGALFLNFNEPVKTRTFNSAGVILYADLSETVTFQFSDRSNADSEDDRSITMTMSRRDYFGLKSAGSVAIQISSTFMSLALGTVDDMADNTILASVKSPFYMQASQFINDITPPTLIAVYYELEYTLLHLLFDDAIVANALSLGQKNIILAKSTGSSTTLTSATVVSLSNTDDIQFSLVNLDASIKDEDDQDNKKVYVNKLNALYDPALNALELMTLAEAVREGNIALGFRLDMTETFLEFEMVYPLENGFKLRMSEMVIHDEFKDVLYTLTNETSYTISTDGYYLKIILSENDYFRILEKLRITDKDFVGITMARDAIEDVSGKNLGRTAEVPCVGFLPDVTDPVLSAWSINLANGTLKMEFSKPMDMSFVKISSIRIWDGDSVENSTGLYLDQTVLIPREDGFQYDLELQFDLNAGTFPTDRDRLFLTETIARSYEKTWITINEGFMPDTAVPANFLPAISVPRQVTLLKIDISPPVMTRFDLDMATRRMTVTFNEGVNRSTNVPSRYLLISNPQDETSTQYALTNSTTTELVYGTSGTDVVMILSTYDVDNIMLKAPGLFTEFSNTYLATTEVGAIRDLSMYANEMDQILFRFAIQVTQFTPDTILPTIVSFDINVNFGTIDIYFSEVVECTRTVPALFKLQYAQFIGTSTEFLFLTSASTVVCPQSFVLNVRINIGSVDMTKLRALLVLSKSEETTFLRPLSGAFVDAFDNANLEVPDGRALAVDFYTADSVSPVLKSFTVTAQLLLILTFNEPVLTSSITVSGIGFQNSVSSPTFTQLLTGFTTFVSADSTKRKLKFALNGDYPAIIGVSPDVFSNQITTFLTATSSVISDTATNPLVEIPESFALALGPSMIEFTLDMDSNVLQLTFSEAVNSTNFSPVGITIQNASTVSSGDVALVTSDKFVQVTSDTYTASLSSDDINTIKFNRIATSIETTFLSVEFGLTNSLDVSTLIPLMKTVTISPYAAERATVFVRDTTAPICVDFGLDLNLGLLYMNYDEPVEPTSFCTSCASLVVASTGKTVYLTVAGQIILRDTTVLRLNITTHDLNNLKLANKAGAVNNLLLFAKSVNDYSNNSLVGNSQLNPVLRDFFIPDTTPPKIISISYDAGRGHIRIFFDEIIELGSLFPENVFLYATADTSGDSVQLTNYSIIELEKSTGAVLIDLATYKQDYNLLGDEATIATSLATTFLVVLNVRDVAANSQSSANTALQAGYYEADSTPPELLSFALVRSTSGTDRYLLDMYFSKVMDVDNFHCTDFILLSNYTYEDENLIRLVLTEDVCSTANDAGTFSREIQVFLPLELFPSSRIVTPHGSSTGAVTFINTVDVPVSVDRLGISLVALNNATTEEVVRPQLYQMGPRVLAYVVNLELGVITMVFSEPTSRDLFRPTALGFYSVASRDFMFCTEDTTMVGFESDSPVFNDLGVVMLSEFDLNRLKGLDVPEGALMHILVGDNMTKSEELFNVVSLLATNELIPQRYQSDITAPVLKNVTLNMGAETIEMEFDEPVRIETIVLTNIQIQSGSVADPEFVRKLTGGAVTIISNRITISMPKVDSAAIKLNPGLAKNISTSYISFDFGTISDMADNGLLPISATAAYNVDTYIKDEVAPDLVSFDLDMDLGLLTMYFSEPVRVESMQTNKITLQGGFSSTADEGYTLQETTILSPDASVMVTSLSANDIHSIKLVKFLCRDRSTTFITFPLDMVYDTSQNNITAISNGNSQPADAFIRDSHAPYVTAYEIDYDASQIRLTFNELVQTISVIPVYLTFYNGPSAALSTYSFTLTVSSKAVFFSDIPFTTVVTVDIALVDLNHIKSLYPLASSVATTYIAVSSTFVLDTYANYMVDITDDAPMQVTTYYKDTVPPVITRYELDFFFGVVRLEFSETVNIASFDDTQMTLQTTSVGRYGRGHYLFDSVKTQEEFSDAYKTTISFSHEFFNYLKFNKIASKKTESYLQYSDRVISDYAGNKLPPLWDGSVQGFFPIIPSRYVADTALPSLNRWFIDTQDYNIHFLFDEPVIVTNISGFLFTTNTGTSNGQASLIAEMEAQGIDLEKLRAQLAPEELAGGNIESFRIRHYTEVTYNEDHTESIFTIPDICIRTENVLQVDGNYTLECTRYITFEYFYNLIVLVRLTRDGTSISMSYESDVAVDMAPSPNNIESRGVSFGLLLGDRDCSLCPTGEYVSKRCTLTADRECSPCDSCATGYFTKTACEAYDNTLCQGQLLIVLERDLLFSSCGFIFIYAYNMFACALLYQTELYFIVCSICPFGSAVKTACATDDTVCGDCTVCSNFEYESRACGSQLDTICETCASCTLSKKDEATCLQKGKYRSWSMSNCCLNEDGDKVRCKELNRENMKITSRDSRMTAFGVDAEKFKNFNSPF